MYKCFSCQSAWFIPSLVGQQTNKLYLNGLVPCLWDIAKSKLASHKRLMRFCKPPGREEGSRHSECIQIGLENQLENGS